MPLKYTILSVILAAMILASCSKQDVDVEITQYTDVSDVNGIAKLGSSLYCSTKGGLVKWNLNTFDYAIITTADGLTSNILTDVVVDNENRVWTSSYEGLSMFDGSVWASFGIADGLPSTEINTLSLDREGVVWASTQDGAAWYENGKFELLAEPGSPGRQMINHVYFDRGGNLWISTPANGVFARMDGIWTRTGQDRGLHNNEADFVSQSWDLTIWCASSNGIFSYRGVGWHFYPSLTAFGAALANHIEASNRRLWFFTYNGVHSSYGGQWNNYTTDDGFITNNATSGLVISDTSAYVGTDIGLSVIDGDNILNYSVPNKPVGSNFISVANDDRGRVWVGSWETGLNVYESGFWTKMTGKNPEDIETVRSTVFGPDGTIVFNTINGVIMNKGREWRKYTRRSGVAADDIRCGLFDSEGRYWVGTSGGVSRMSDGRWQRVRTLNGLPSDDVWACGIDADDNVWFGTTKGIVSFTGDDFTDRTSEIGLDEVDVRSIHVMGDAVYFGTNSGNLIVYENGEWDVFSNGFLNTKTPILSIDSDANGVLWLGTMGDGIVRIENGKSSKISKAEGLPYDFVRSVTCTDDAVWAACYGGVAKIESVPTEQ